MDRLSCGGYVFYVSDGSQFQRWDVEQVKISRHSAMASFCSVTGGSSGRKRKHRQDDEDVSLADEDAGFFDFHMCDETQVSTSFAVFNKCKSWSLLSDTQRAALSEIQNRVDTDHAEGRYFTCVMIEGAGGCGKTRLMSHIMNHKQLDTLVMYVTKQNKRVQDFIHGDCLAGEPDPTVQKPIDLTPMSSGHIASIIRSNSDVGKFALTAEKLAFAVGGLSPSKFNTGATRSSLNIDYEIFSRECVDQMHRGRNIVLLLDEYTMLQPPLIHAIAYHVMRVSRSPLVLILGGDRLQCGPVGWDITTNNTGGDGGEEERALFTNDVRREIVEKIDYVPLVIEMNRLQRCRRDPALADCVKRLRRVCETGRRSDKYVLNLVLARYCVEAGVDLFQQELQPDGEWSVQQIVPDDLNVLDFDGTGFEIKTDSSVEEVQDRTHHYSVAEEDDEEYDTRGAVFKHSTVPPTLPMYDLLPLVEHFTTLYTKLAEISFSGGGDHERSRLTRTDAICESVTSIRERFPAFIVVTNKLCNELAERFLLALYTQVRERLLSAPVPESLLLLKRQQRLGFAENAWTEQLKNTLRQCVRSLKIDENDASQRQTLFVGMVYKMTSTFNTDATAHSLCNGESVVLTSIVFDEYDYDSLGSMEAVLLRKLDRDTDTDFTLYVGYNQNRMTNAKRIGVMPFVPYVTENIYQMQGNTMPKNASSYIDLVNAPSRSAYVALSRFQNSDSIKGIIISQ